MTRPHAFWLCTGFMLAITVAYAVVVGLTPGEVFIRIYSATFGIGMGLWTHWLFRGGV